MMAKLIRRLVTSNRLSYRVALYLYRKYEKLKLRRELRARIGKIRADKYLNISYRPGLNVIIITVDSLRSSHLSYRGYKRATTPFLDSFKSRFTAISASPWTAPSVASILTGLYPHNHGATINDKVKNLDKVRSFRRIRGDVLTLPEMLTLLEYETYFATSVDIAFYPLRGRVIPERYSPFTRAEDLLNDLTKWICRRRENFFAYVQLGDLHQPLNPPEDFRSFFGIVKQLPNIHMWDFRKPEEQSGDIERFREYRENRELLYDNTLRYVDSAIERFYNSLKDRGLVDSTIIVITADHGEEFWEHTELETANFYDPRGYYGVGHGHNVFNEIIEVPLLMSGQIPHLRPEHYVSTVDIVPTLVDLLGITHVMRFDGGNIFRTDAERPLLSEACGFGYEKKALVIGRYKLVYSSDDCVAWLFDIKNDPGEQRPIVDGEITSVFINKLTRILQQGEKRKIRESAGKQSL